MENKFKKGLVQLSEDAIMECYVVPIDEIPEFQSLLSMAPVFMNTETFFPDQKTSFYGMFDENMLFKGKIKETEELIFDNGIIGQDNYYIVVNRIDFYNVEIKTGIDKSDKYTIDIIEKTLVLKT